MIVEPAVLGEELICTEVYQPIKHQLQSWKQQDLGGYMCQFFSLSSVLFLDVHAIIVYLYVSEFERMGNFSHLPNFAIQTLITRQQ